MQIALEHHERPDGRGYSNGLKPVVVAAFWGNTFKRIPARLIDLAENDQAISRNVSPTQLGIDDMAFDLFSD